MNCSLYQINTRVLLSTLGRNATLDDIPDTLLDQLASRGFDWIWLLGVWTIGPTGRFISRTHPEWRRDYVAVLPDVSDQDICGSPFAVAAYAVDPALGGDAALARFRERLRSRGLRLMLDFVPNHVAHDHPWVESHPEFFFEGTQADRLADPGRWVGVHTGRVFALGRDPHFPGWPDTLQLNYFQAGLRAAMVEELKGVAKRCDGVRCDMAMLLEPEVFARTWGAPSGTAPPPPFWPDAIRATREAHPHFLFLGEVYWGYEWALQQHGFDYCYDKTLYDRLVAGDGPGVHEHLVAPLSYQSRLARFLENHDEQRIASRLPWPAHRAAAVITYLAPGMRFFFDGQLEGRKVRVPVHLSRGPLERPNLEVSQFYSQLLAVIQGAPGRSGAWHLLDPLPAWEDNPTSPSFVCYLIEHALDHLLVIVNYAPCRGQARVRLPGRAWLEGVVELRDRLSNGRFRHSSEELTSRGLYVDLPEWGIHLFSVECV